VCSLEEGHCEKGIQGGDQEIAVMAG